jgi:hypothetical protein
MCPVNEQTQPLCRRERKRIEPIASGRRSLVVATTAQTFADALGSQQMPVKRAMAVVLVPREDNAFANDNPPAARNAVLAAIASSEISKKHHHDILKSGSAMLQQPRRLGLVQGVQGRKGR